MRIILDTLRRYSRTTLVLCFLAVLAIGHPSYILRAGTEIDLWALFLAPTAAVAWVWPRRLSMAFAVYAAAVSTLSASVAHNLASVPSAVEFAINAASFVTVVLLVNRLGTLLSQQTHLARFDALTGTMNATSFGESVGRELARGKRYDHPTTVAFLDVDDFKELNDTQGHRAGDEALRCLADVMCRQVRDVDTVGRLGGDEFGILMPETSEEAARVALDRVRMRVHDLASEKSWPIGVSIGASSVAGTFADASSDEVLRHADGAMYRVKSANKNDVLVEAFG